MSAPSHPYDTLGLEFPFTEHNEDNDRHESGAAWGGMDESPFAQALEHDEASLQESAAMQVGEEERLAWLDLEEEAPVTGFGLEDERFDEHGHEALHEHDEAQGEYLDDEERDAGESYEAWQEQFEPEAEAEAPSVTPLGAEQRAWVLALDRSAIERLRDPAARDRFLAQDWSDIEFPGNVPKGQSATATIKQHWTLARSLFNAMAEVVPERRVPSSIRFIERPAVKVPGQPSHRLYAEARDAFVRMQAAAKAEGVDLVILSSWRSRARQAAASANQPNPNAVARKASAHMYGLAMDVRMGVAGLPIKEINTRVDRATAAKAGTSAKMGNLVRMYRSPVYKWLFLRAREFGWYPYRNEPWHWEYNPPGLKARFEGATRGELEQEAGLEASAYTEAPQYEDEYEDEAAPSPFLRTFTAKALGVKVAVYVTQAARTAREVEMLVYAHGLDLCKPVLRNRPATFISEAPFKLGALVEASGRPIVLVVPFLDWERLAANAMAYGRKWHRIAQPETFNRVAAEAMDQVRAITNHMPTLQRLILSGHSRAYGFFDALAHEHASPHMRSGALSCPTHVWALDTTYSAPIADWRAWLRSREDLQATVVFRQGRSQAKGSTVVKELATGIRGREFAKLAAASNGRLTVMPVAANKVSHCAIPATYLPRLLAALPALTRSQEDFDAGESYEALAEQDLAELETEAAASEYEDEAVAEDARNEAEGEDEDIPQRFDAFGDERDSEWGAESSEELASPQDEAEAPLSFALDTEDESGLSGSGLTPAEQKAVEITSLFETGKRGGFYGLSGNFDGQGLSFGLVNWTIGTGSLQPLLRDFAKEHPARWVSVFGADASRFLQLISRRDKAAQAEQHRFAVQEMNTVSTNARGRKIWTVRQPWVGYFRKLSEDTAFQGIQVRYVRNLLARGDYYCRQFQLRSEQAFCFMFDAVASHGKWWLVKKFDRVEKRRVLVEKALQALASRYGAGRIPESEVLLAIADVLASTSAQRWADNVRQRKRWFVTGEHPRKRELEGLQPRANVAYTTSSSARTVRQEAGEDEAGEESEAAGDAQLILGKWTVWVQGWVWEYEFLPGGKVRWRDTRSLEKGEGTWSLTAKSIDMKWKDSTTTERWDRPLNPGRQTGAFTSSYYNGPYRAQKIGGASAVVPAWADAIDPFPAVVAVPLNTTNVAMTAAFAPVTVSTANHLCASLSDLTGAPPSTPFASLHGDEMVFVGSLMKVGAMYAAFALRARVQAFADAARANGVTTAPELFALIRRAWSPKLRALFPARPAKSFGNGQDVTVPQVDRMFTLTPAGRIEFAKSPAAITNAQLDVVGEFGTPVGQFHEWMRLMMRWSNNTAASRCVLALGYFYINGLFARAGFFAAGQGLWMSGDYDGHDWVATQAEKNANAAGVALSPRWATAQKRAKSNFVANALQVGRLMTAMAADTLADPASCDEMRTLANQMDMLLPRPPTTPRRGIGSYALAALARVGRTPTKLSSKIGFGDDSFSHDCAIVERVVGGKTLRYAAVVLGSAKGRDRRDFSDLFVLLDATVVARNP